MKSRGEVEPEERRYNRAKARRKKIHLREMLGKSRNAVFFRGFVCRLGRKVGSLKRAGAEVADQNRQEKWHAAVARSTFQVRMYKHLAFGALLEVGM